MIDLRRWPNADEVLDRALELPAGARAAFVAAATDHDPELRRAIETVLAEASGPDGFLTPGEPLTGPLADELAREIAPAVADHGSVLRPGDRIEHYEIVSAIGRGGMGEVFRARDTRLHRDVAIKVLPARFARDRSRLARFRREARLLASLSHPGIGAIFGLAEDAGVEALVLELVEGPTLSERIGGRQLPIDEVIAIGRQIAEALGAAHEANVIHRDLKPANIKVTPEGVVKILDFGLAKVFDIESDAALHDSTDLSTASPNAMFGTAAYMSPEQVRRRSVDQRADIWAFGCVLFEMLTGTRAFPGDSIPDVLARVMEREPAFGLLPPATPPALRRLLRRALDKNPARRLGHIDDALLEFDDAVAEPEADQAPATPLRWWPIALAVGGLAAAASVVALLFARSGDPRSEPPASRLVMALPLGDTPMISFQPMIAVSPDGRTVVYRARRGGMPMLFRRQIDRLESEPIPGTDGATGPFFSPDGRWLGFDGGGVIKRVSLAGGSPVVVADAPGGVTAAWAADDRIVFATNTGRVLQRVASSGGTPEAISTLDPQRGDTRHTLPQVLPGGDAVLFSVVTGTHRYVAVLDTTTRQVATILEGTHPRLLAGGYLLFAREGGLWGVRFDTAARKLAGTPVPLVEGVQDTDNTVLHFDVGGDGTLVYLPATENVLRFQKLVWFDRRGVESPVPIPPGPYGRPALAPDDARVALAVEDRSNSDIWIGDLTNGSMSRLTLEPAIETAPIWSPDGRFVAFRSERERPGLYRRDAQGAGPIEPLTQTDGPIHSPYSWTPDGSAILLSIFRSFGSQAVAMVTPPDATVRVLLDGDFAQTDPQVSPDGRWLAYQSDESGQAEIYVRPFPRVTGGRWQVSVAGGRVPRWSPDGRELFFIDEVGLMAARVLPAEPFRFDPPSRLFAVRMFAGRGGNDYEVSRDGRRFLFILDGPQPPERQAQIVVVQGWRGEVAAKLAGQR